MASKHTANVAAAELPVYGWVGIDRSRSYTREEICLRYGYDPDSVSGTRRVEMVQNRNTFFRTYFLKRGLPAMPVGKTFEVSGELYHQWIMKNSRPIEGSTDWFNDAPSDMQLLTRAEVAKLLSVGANTVTRMRASGLLKAVPHLLPNIVRYSAADIQQFIATQRPKRRLVAGRKNFKHPKAAKVSTEVRVEQFYQQKAAERAAEGVE